MPLPTFFDALDSMRRLGVPESELELYLANYEFFQKNKHIIDAQFRGWAAAVNGVLYLDTQLRRLQQTLGALPHGNRGYIEEILPTA